MYAKPATLGAGFWQQFFYANDTGTGTGTGTRGYFYSPYQTGGFNGASFDYTGIGKVQTATDGAASYVVRGGETLCDIARSLYGDETLWYVIAEANGLTAPDGLAAGTTLKVPSVTRSSNTASTFKVYQTVTTSFSPRSLTSAVTRRAPCTHAMAAMMRSAGSPCMAPSNEPASAVISAVTGSNCASESARRSANHGSNGTVRGLKAFDGVRRDLLRVLRWRVVHHAMRAIASRGVTIGVPWNCSRLSRSGSPETMRSAPAASAQAGTWSSSGSVLVGSIGAGVRIVVRSA